MNTSITVAYVNYQSTWSSNSTFYLVTLLNEFSRKHTDVSILPRPFPSQNTFLNQITDEINTGGGPDILLLDDFSTMNWKRMSLNNQFAGLSTYINADNEFVRENYFGAALDAGALNKEQYVLPISIKCPSFFTSEEKLRKSTDELFEVNSYNDLLDLLNASVAYTRIDPMHIPIVFNTSSNLYLASLLDAFQVPTIDILSGHVTLPKKFLMLLCNFLKSLNVVCPLKKNTDRLTECIYQSKNFSHVDYYFQSYGFSTWLGFQELMMEYIDEKARAILVPAYESARTYTATLSFYGAINSNSRQKKCAYDILRGLMDEACGEAIGWDFPANRKTLETWIDKQVVGNEWTITIDNIPQSIIHTEDYGAQLIKIANDITKISTVDLNALKIIDTAMMPYIQGNKNFDECYQKSVNQLELYVNE